MSNLDQLSELGTGASQRVATCPLPFPSWRAAGGDIHRLPGPYHPQAGPRHGRAAQWTGCRGAPPLLLQPLLYRSGQLVAPACCAAGCMPGGRLRRCSLGASLPRLPGYSAPSLHFCYMQLPAGDHPAHQAPQPDARQWHRPVLVYHRQLGEPVGVPLWQRGRTLFGRGCNSGCMLVRGPGCCTPVTL